ncbi:GntR family transcriptional regulator [Limibaculum sp. M0105]|uniref:GntR family transcriptional regulator n=1 Tax=Thermohalobaculum xanthum TaxID=2753746 RepID=A0A8J7SDD0_9RHOB|nr:GntR family transcriptional regulator [Thermohalobaculum xanthum]MBK0399148.1 GntR family transcriptional regulator [Thermohalobaculum xanthum]
MTGRRADLLHDKIEDLILTGELVPGERLDEVSLATRFGVSRTPIREALMQLAASGLIDLRPRRGAIVAEIGPKRMVEMFEVMAELEAICARLAARRATESDEAQICAHHQACAAAAAASDEDAYYYENEAFHEAIDAAAHQEFLSDQTRALRRRLKPYRRLQLRARGRVQNSFDEHEAVVRAILAHDAEAAAEAMRAHIVVQGERFTDLLASLETPRGARAR